MFEMIDEDKKSPEHKKALLTKAAIFVVALVMVAGVIYLLAFAGAN